MEAMKLFECLGCKAVQCPIVAENQVVQCPYCGSFCKEYYVLKCIPVENNEKHFRLNKDLVLLLNNFAGQECVVRVEPC